MSRFAIGDNDWPGLSKLSEEAGEVQQVIGKLMESRGERAHWDGSDLKIRLQDEMADLAAALAFVIKHCDLDEDAMVERSNTKFNLFEKWHSNEDRPDA